MERVKKIFGFVPTCLLLLALVIVSLLFTSFSYADISVMIMAMVGVFILHSAVVGLYVFDKKSLYRAGVTLLIFLAVGLVIYLALSESGLLSRFKNIELIQEYVESLGFGGVLIFITLQFLQVVILPVPAFVTTMAGAALFGPVYGFLLSLVGIVIGSMFSFTIGKLFGAKLVSWILGEETLQKYTEKIKGRDKLVLASMFLLPIFPDDILCLVAGLSSYNFKQFFVVILLTRPIGILMTSVLGNTMLNIPFTGYFIFAWIGLFAAMITLFALLWKYSEKIITKAQSFWESLTKSKKKSSAIN